MPDETLADLYANVFGRPAALRYVENPNTRAPRRPMPRQLRSLEERMRDPNAGVRGQANAQVARGGALSASADRAQAFAPPRNQFAEAGEMALEMSGLPAIRRGSEGLTRSVVENTPERAWGALGELGLGAVQAGTLMALPRAGGAAPAPTVARAPRLPVNPVRLPGRASDGSVLPIREPAPFRNSLRGGNEDLFDAASQGSRPAPRTALRANDANNGQRVARAEDGGANNPYLDALRTEGFDTETPLYRGMTQPLAGDDFARNPRLQGSEQYSGVSFTRSPREASGYAAEGGGGVVYPAYMRGRLESGPEYMRAVQGRAKQLGITNQEAAAQIQQEYAKRGITGVEWPANQYGVGDEVRIFDAANVRSRFAPPSPRPEAPQGRMGEVSRPTRKGSPMDALLHDPAARRRHADSATVHQTTFGDRPLTMYDFGDSPALTNVRFQPVDSETYTIAMSSRGVDASSPMSTKARAFADAISAIEHHAAQNNAAQRGLRYLFTGESDAHTRLFRGLAERAEWPRGAVVHDTPAGFEISFAPTRSPFSGQLPFNQFAHQPEYKPNLGQEGVLRLSDAINNRTRQIAASRPSSAIDGNARPPDASKSNRSRKPPSGGFFFGRRH